MAASKTVLQLSPSHNSTVPRHGVVTLLGYKIQISVDRGHLVLDDGIGADRRHFRLSRVGHGLKRLVVVGADGYVSLSALRWLADQGASFSMLERDGKSPCYSWTGQLIGCETSADAGVGTFERNRFAHRTRVDTSEAAWAGKHRKTQTGEL